MERIFKMSLSDLSAPIEDLICSITLVTPIVGNYIIQTGSYLIAVPFSKSHVLIVCIEFKMIHLCSSTIMTCISK